MWPNPQETGESVTFTEEIVNGKFFYSACQDTSQDGKKLLLKQQ